MAAKNPIIGFELNPDGASYTVTYCDGTSDQIPVPCTCDSIPGQNPPGQATDFGLTRCEVESLIVYWTQTFFESLIDAVASPWVSNVVPTTALLLTRWMFDNRIDSRWFNNLIGFLTAYPTADRATVAGWTAAHLYQDFGNLVDCCLSEDMIFDSGFLACVKINLTSGALYAAQAEEQQKFWLAMSQFIGVFDTTFWQSRFFEYQAKETGSDQLDCGVFTDCTEQEGCPPYGELYELVYYDYDSPALVGGVPDCYHTGDPCTPFNSLRGLNFEWDFSLAPRCVKEIWWNGAGNSKTLARQCDIFINGAFYTSVTGMLQNRTKCGMPDGLPMGKYTLPDVVEISNLRLEFTDLIGSDQTYGINLHCMRLIQYVP